MFVLDQHGQPLQPTNPAYARKLLRSGRAVVHRHTPFVIRLRDRTAADSTVAGVQVGIDPGSKHTGIAVFTDHDGNRTGRYSLQLDHRGGAIRDKLASRAARRRGRRSRNLRYRASRFSNRTEPKGWLAPSLRHRVDTTMSWVGRLIQTKNATPIEEFLTTKPALLAKILRQAKASLRDAAAVNATRWALWRALETTGLPVATSSGARTKWNRSRTGAPKSHTLDALHVGELQSVTAWPCTVLVVTATGRGAYARTTPDRYGFPRLVRPRIKVHHGFQTGDLVRAHVTIGKKTGIHLGRVLVRSSGSFDITTRHGRVAGINHRHIRHLQRADGYGYLTQKETDHDD